ncbi:hypothetical protein DFH11DRAFT_1769383 [Phellopilus nigrolimitatus]|nr:hypothetical protein DFH11DRAFT_1769383 [Phellopilus nigrolimitatus]
MPGIIDSNFVLERRGGSDVTSDSIDVSSYPTAPPSSTHTHFKSIPTIGGTEGGFIGLVVGLGVIFLGSCVGVFFLLRNWKHGGRTVRGKSGEVGVEALPAGPDAPRRRGTLFGFRSTNPRKAGWVRAPGEDEDEWDASDNLNAGVHCQGQEALAAALVTGIETRDRQGPYCCWQGEGKKRVFGERRLSKPLAGHSFDDPFEPPARTTSPSYYDGETAAHYSSQDPHAKGRHTSLDSTETAVTLPGGTRFKESL